MSGHAETPAPKKGKKSGNSTIGTVIWIVFFILLFIVVSSKFNSCKKESKQASLNKQNNESVNSTPSTPVIYKQTWVIESHVEVNYTGEYSQRIELPEGKGLSFENSSEPYCITNASGEEHCGKMNEDISSQFPGCKANTELKFKSSNGKSGHITINIWILK